MLFNNWRQYIYQTNVNTTIYHSSGLTRKVLRLIEVSTMFYNIV